MVGRATLSTASGDTATAANSYRCLLDYWQTTGNRTMLWTTARNAAQLLLDQDRNHTAAIVLAAADAAHTANTPDTPIAEGLQRLTTILTQRLGASSIETLHHKAQTLGEVAVLDLVRQRTRPTQRLIMAAISTRQPIEIDPGAAPIVRFRTGQEHPRNRSDPLSYHR